MPWPFILPQPGTLSASHRVPSPVTGYCTYVFLSSFKSVFLNLPVAVLSYSSSCCTPTIKYLLLLHKCKFTVMNCNVSIFGHRLASQHICDPQAENHYSRYLLGISIQLSKNCPYNFLHLNIATSTFRIIAPTKTRTVHNCSYNTYS